jgi:glycosyltransferase involved in cell wall biosynthesis
VLVVAYYFPPAGGSGVQRTLQFVRHLPAFGWEPVVLTVDHAAWPVRDDTLLDRVPPGTPVFRTRIPEPHALYRRLTRLPAGEGVDLDVNGLDPREASGLQRLAGWFRSALFVPDARVGWIPFAVPAGLRAIRAHRPSAIYSTAPPYTCHLAAMALARLSGLPWLADFRDSWIGWPGTPVRRPAPAAWLERRMERAVVAGADRLATVTAGVRRDLIGRSGGGRPGRWRVIPNGYEPADIPPSGPPGAGFTLVHAGSIHRTRHPSALLDSLPLLASAAPQVLDDLRLHLVGRVCSPTRCAVAASPFRHLVRLTPQVSHPESLRLQGEAAVLLLLVDRGAHREEIATGKIYEYLGTGRPILALAPPGGEAARLVRGLGAGLVADPDDPAAVAGALRILHRRWCEGSLGDLCADPRRLRPFQRRHLTGRLAALLDEVVRPRPEGRP